MWLVARVVLACVASVAAFVAEVEFSLSQSLLISFFFWELSLRGVSLLKSFSLA